MELSPDSSSNWPKEVLNIGLQISYMNIALQMSGPVSFFFFFFFNYIHFVANIRITRLP